MTITASDPTRILSIAPIMKVDDSLLQKSRRLAPFSLIDASVECLKNGGVAELEISAQQCSARVTDRFAENHTASVSILSSTKWIARCSCCSTEEMDEQWCVHALAVLFAGHNTGELSVPLESASDPFAIRVSTTSALDICRVVKSELAAHSSHEPSLTIETRPTVELFLDCHSDTLGIKVLFDGVVQKPADVSHCESRSNRSLDAIFLQFIDGEGFWDNDKEHWYVHESKAIQTILGLAEEFSAIRLDGTGEQLTVSHQSLHAKVEVTWQDSCAELLLLWVFPDGQALPKPAGQDGTGLIGNGPYWTLYGSTIYRLNSEAENLSKLFPFSSSLLLPRSTTGALIELISSDANVERLLTVTNPELQPETRIVTPSVSLRLERILNPALGKNDQSLEIKASLDFSYPTAAASDNVVFVPDSAFETKQSEKMLSLGFRQTDIFNRYQIGGDSALDLFYGDTNPFPELWSIEGRDDIARSLRFANLALTMDVINSDSDAGVDKRSQKAAVFDARGINWFECNVKLTLNNAQIPLSSLFKNPLTQQDKWIQLDGGAYARVPGGGLKQLKTSLGMLEPNFHLASTIRSQLTTAQALGLARYNSAGVIVSLDERAAALRDKLASFDEVKPVKPPRSFTGQLRPYQQSGLGWLLFLKEYGLDGILADEMGLGKTVQTLALLEFNRVTQSKKGQATSPAIIVAPTSVIMNWYYEAKRFAPSMSVLLLHGPRRKAEFARIPEHDLIITSYALMRIDKFELERFKYSYIVLDEAQNIKNPLAATTRAAKSMPAERRLALTGTPTENRPLELWSIVDFLMPGYLGNLDFFRNQIEKPILEQGTQNEVASFLHQKTRPFIMRRLKRDVEKDLPAKTESEVHVEMTPAQQVLYTQILDEVRPKIFEAVEEKGIRGASISILAALLRLRQVCNHPRSIEAYKGVTEYDSGKFELLKELLTEALENGQKVLLFSQFREMLSIIRHWLEEQSFKFLYLDGGTRNRQDLVDQFNSDESVRLFLISLKAGGTGLNLTAADTVILYDPWWNPAVEMQAVDRAHRIGQTKKVNVYRLITENSIEQKIMELKSRKAAMVDALISDTELSSTALTREDLEHFFSPLPTM